MNVRIVPRGFPQRTDMYSGIQWIRSDGVRLTLWAPSLSVNYGPIGPNPLAESYVRPGVTLALIDVAEILLDDDPGGGF